MKFFKEVVMNSVKCSGNSRKMNTEGFALHLVVEKPHVSSTCSFFELVDMEV